MVALPLSRRITEAPTTFAPNEPNFRSTQASPNHHHRPHPALGLPAAKDVAPRPALTPSGGKEFANSCYRANASGPHLLLRFCSLAKRKRACNDAKFVVFCANLGKFE